MLSTTRGNPIDQRLSSQAEAVAAGAEPVFHNILVAVDGGEPTRWALAAALRLAEPGGKVSLLHVVSTPNNWGMPELPPPEEPCALCAENDFVLERCAAEIPADRLGTRIFREGDVNRQIVRAARDAHADLLVIGTHGRHCLGRLLLGSTAVYVLRHVPCPVLVAGHGSYGIAPGTPPARILVGIDDDGGPSVAAAAMAQRIAARHQARIALVHVIPRCVEFPPEYGIPMEDSLEPHVREAGEAFLGAFPVPAPGAAGVERAVREGDAARELLAAAAEWKADLIVMGTHGRHGLGRLLLGSTAEIVACKAPCPVMYVTAPGIC